mmetsp:Transcript_930/g.2206  ORF Transcript_930/g.2206 Transcript_930/m.2206 type:complete len:106 (-) Transcript_930:158-475(-)
MPLQMLKWKALEEALLRTEFLRSAMNNCLCTWKMVLMQRLVGHLPSYLTNKKKRRLAALLEQTCAGAAALPRGMRSGSSFSFSGYFEGMVHRGGLSMNDNAYFSA